MISSAFGSPRLQNSLREHNAAAQRALERLMTGKRINRPSDDPAGFIGAEELRHEIVRLQAEVKRIGVSRGSARQQGSTLQNVQTQLTDLKSAIEGSFSNLLTDEERAAYSEQIERSLEAVARIQKQHEPSGGGPTPSPLLAPSSTAQILPGVDPINLDASADAVDEYLDEAIFSQAALAAYERYDLDVRQRLATDMIETHTVALSLLEDADFAEEAANLATAQILAQGAQAAIALSGSINADHIAALIEGLVADEAGAIAGLNASASDR